MDDKSSLTAISPIDGRYKDKTIELANFFSEFGLIKYRVMVEIEYFIALCEIPLPQLQLFDKNYFSGLRRIYKEFSLEDAERVKDIEKRVNHDVKAIEYFLKEYFESLGISEFREFIHFALTSQDINNTAIPISLKDALNHHYYPQVNKVLFSLEQIMERWENIPMISRTHGQPASPTRMGKEIKVFHERILNQLNQLQNIPPTAKFGGATGNFNAHKVAYPDVDWVSFANDFLNTKLGLRRQQTTTQIDQYDNLSAVFDNIKRINTILIDLCRDIWTYISMDYFKQKIAEDEVGSSTMPHKVNPIDFENAEGNLGIANANLEHLSAKLPISRLQRDLTDSTVTRNIGVPLAHTFISLKSILKGMDKLIINKERIEKDLRKNWMVISEGIQTILRREGYENPYEVLKEFTRTNARMEKEDLDDFIDGLEVSAAVKEELKQITPFNYIGV